MRHVHKAFAWALALVVIRTVQAEKILTVTEDGAYRKEFDVSSWTPGERFIYLSASPDCGYNYPWQGEERLDYEVDGYTLRVNGSVVGVDLSVADLPSIEEPGKIVTAVVPGYDFSRAAEFENLRAIYFLGPVEDSGKGFKNVTGLRNLRGIFFSAGELSGSVIRDLTSCKGLVVLDFEVAVLPEGSLENIAKLPNLCELSLASTPDEELFALKGNKNLRTLTRYWEVADTGWVDFLKSLTGLEELTIIQAEVADEVYDYLARSNTLKSLSLPYAGVHEDDLPRISKMTGLEKLDLSGTGITDDDLKYIGGLNRLSSLAVGGGGESCLTAEGLKHLSGLANLEHLDLTSTGLMDADIESIKTLPSLKSLVLVSTAITDKGLMELKRLKGLRYLDVSGTEVSVEAVATFIKAMPDCNVVKYY